MLVNTIDEVVTRLDAIIADSITHHDRRGYFAALYNRVTRRVREGIANGEFEDNPRMERLDVAFANRYFDAYDRYPTHKATRPWTRVFDAARDDGLIVLQHLLLGMVTHITLDLGIAAVEVAPGASLRAMHKDFLHINVLLGEQIGIVENELIDIAGNFHADLGHLLDLAEDLALGVDRTAAMVLMHAARDRAWRFAERLAVADPARLAAELDRQETETTLLVDVLLLGEPAVHILVGGGSHDVAGNIHVLTRAEG